MKRRKVLVCGGTGFIGRNIIEKLRGRNDLDVIGVYNERRPFNIPGVSWVQANLTHQSAVNRVIKGTDVIVQAAATTSGSKDILTRPHIHVTDNAIMNSLIFRAANDADVEHVVFFITTCPSSCA